MSKTTKAFIITVILLACLSDRWQRRKDGC